MNKAFAFLMAGLMSFSLTVITAPDAEAKKHWRNGWSRHDNGLHKGWYKNKHRAWRNNDWQWRNSNDWRWRNNWNNNWNWQNNNRWYGSRFDHRFDSRWW
jgi:hypothetical protein